MFKVGAVMILIQILTTQTYRYTGLEVSGKIIKKEQQQKQKPSPIHPGKVV